MESHRLVTSALGFCLLPSELIQYILLQLALPDIIRLKSVNRYISTIIEDRDFVREYNSQVASTSWLFLYRKRWCRDAVLHGFSDCSNRLFKLVIAEIMKEVVHPGEDVYFLAASGNFFLFALNTSQEVISANLRTKAVKKIPPSPLGPRGTSSWRRSGMKLLSDPPGSDHFHFLFAELSENRPFLYVYDSKTDNWQSLEAREAVGDISRTDNIFLTANSSREGCVLIARGSQHEIPVVLRPKFVQGVNEDGQIAVGFARVNGIDQLHVYGDGNLMIIRSDCVYERNFRSVKVLNGLELWALSSNGRHWELMTEVPKELINKVKKPYGAIMGCLEQRNGIIRVVLISNLEGAWDVIWLCYDLLRNNWSHLPLPECKMKGSNMAGIAFSSGLTLS